MAPRPLRRSGSGPTLVRPSIGAPAPAIELTDAAERPWRLRDHLGHPVVVIFHRHIH